MLIGASAVAVIAITALLVGVITDRAFVIYLSIGTCVVGLLLMVADAWARRRPGPDGPARPAVTGQAGVHHPHAVEFFDDDSLVDRELVRDERVLHSDTGPGEPDRSREEALETILYDHYPGAKRRRKTLPRANP